MRYSLNWRDHGDEWLYRVGQEFRAQNPGYGFGISLSVPLEGGDASGEIVATHVPDSSRRTACRLSFLAEGQGFVEAEPDSNEEAWKAALSKALKKLGQQETWEWTAIIGDAPYAAPHVNPLLVAPGYLGPIHLAPTGVAISDDVDSVPPSFGSWREEVSSPIAVRGRSAGYSEHDAIDQAWPLLTRVCAFLSLAWECCVVVREAPAPVGWGVRVVPERRRLPDHDERTGIKDPFSFRQVSVPDWAAAAWTRTERDQSLAGAVDMFHEALRAEARHPSLAFVGFVAVIETMGARLHDLKTCDCCTACHLKVGSSERFRKAIRHARQEQDLSDELARNPQLREHLKEMRLLDQLIIPQSRLRDLYEKRSKTAHAGVLFGDERLQSALLGRLLSFHPEQSFIRRDLTEMKNDARLLLLQALRADPQQTSPQ